MADLQKHKSNTLSLIQVSNNFDLLKARPISRQLKDCGRRPVLTTISVSVNKCLMGLNILMTKNDVALLCEDLVDKYRSDSVEDIQEALKGGRQGTYTFGHEGRHALTMQVISLWMDQHLNKKIDARERQLEALRAKQLESQNAPVNYPAYIERMEKERLENVKLKNEKLQKAMASAINDRDYSQYRKKFYDNKKKEGES